MKDEIKEILDKLYLDFEKAGLTAPEYSDLRDYITNLQEELDKTIDIYTEEYNLRKHLDFKLNILQEENERLKENAIHNDKVVDKAKWNEMLYKSRIEKAIEYIKNINERAYKDEYCTCFSTYDLLNILQGE